MALIVVLSPDLLFGSKVQGALSAAGHDASLCAFEEEARAAAGEADLLIIDLMADTFDGAVLVESMLMGNELGATKTLGYFAHTEDAVKDHAIEAGFDVVIPRSRLHREGPDVVGRLLASSSN